MTANKITEPFVFGKNPYNTNISSSENEFKEKMNTRSDITKRWDKYFHSICEAVSSKSPCLSRKIGAILVRDHSIVATGYNGPARGIPHCGHERLMEDKWLQKALRNSGLGTGESNTCPRRLMNFKSGEGLQWCTAQHAESNCIANAARLGVSILDTTLYMNCVVPCKNCFGILINAGIREIVVDSPKLYDDHSGFIIDNSHIIIRSFQN